MIDNETTAPRTRLEILGEFGLAAAELTKRIATLQLETNEFLTAVERGEIDAPSHPMAQRFYAAIAAYPAALEVMSGGLVELGRTLQAAGFADLQQN